MQTCTVPGCLRGRCVCVSVWVAPVCMTSAWEVYAVAVCGSCGTVPVWEVYVMAVCGSSVHNACAGCERSVQWLCVFPVAQCLCRLCRRCVMVVCGSSVYSACAGCEGGVQWLWVVPVAQCLCLLCKRCM